MRLAFALLFWIPFASAPLLWACGPGGVYEEVHLSLFDYELAAPRDADPPTPSPGYPTMTNPADLQSLHKINRHLWHAYGQDIGLTHLDEEIYTLTQEQISARLTAQAPDRLRAREAYTYMLAAKEVLGLLEHFGWTSRPSEEIHRAGDLERLLTRCEQHARADTTHAFIAQRYGFLAVRLAAELQSSERARVLFDETVANHGPGLVTDWASGYLARAHYVRREMTQALPIYFDLMKVTPVEIARPAYQSLQWALAGQPPDQVAELESKLSDTDDKVWVWLISADRYRGNWVAKAFERVLTLAPDSPDLALRAGSIIHGIEIHELEGRWDLLTAPREASAPKQFAALRQAFLKAATHPKVPHKAYWYLAACYLSLLDGDGTAAETHLAAARAVGDTDSRIRDQANVLEVLLMLGQNYQGSADHDWKTRALACLDRFQVNRELDPEHAREKYQSLMSVIAQLFFKEGDIPRAALTYEKAGSDTLAIEMLGAMVDNADLDAFAKQVDNPSDPMDRFLFEGSVVANRDRLLQIRALRAFRRGAWREAHTYFDQMGAGDASPIVHFSMQNPELVNESESQQTSLRGLVTRLEALDLGRKGLAKHDPIAHARITLMMGHIFYSLRSTESPYIAGGVDRRRWTHNYIYWGTEGHWFTGPMNDAYGSAASDEMDLLNRYLRAERYYLEVADNEAAPELAAEACIMVQASRNRFLSREIVPSRDPEHQYFSHFVRKYKDTAFFEAYRPTCPPLSAFEPNSGDTP
ncbi:hypothetical protein SCOR_34970 [Sulfidibacter corallicola]|uniref:Uncharacterized protein n=1 Tax=Sulfidibacter corallicola TaxID=2818388 RepID=A0A8A4TJ90_SULCO|nr:hypothetical protein [Sulfidibacter corallicola]QTD49264.1 hypothetical protein J3U87_27070 [Sulfidibacter corallicola]